MSWPTAKRRKDFSTLRALACCELYRLLNQAKAKVACEQALLFGRAKRVSRERASERRSLEGQRRAFLGPSLARSREARPNRRACSQAKAKVWIYFSDLYN